MGIMNRKLLVNARFWGGASSVLVEDGVIRGLGVEDSSAERVDLAGRQVLPGFVDSHVHAFWLGAELARSVDVAGSKTIGEVLERLKAWGANLGRGDWVMGRGFDQDKVAEKRWPTGEELASVGEGRPVVVTRVCGHGGAVSPDLGDGVVVEHALWDLLRRAPAMNASGPEAAALATLKVCKEQGVVGIGSMLEELSQLDVVVEMAKGGRLPMPVTGNFPGREFRAVADRGWKTGTTFGEPGRECRVGAAKFFADGSMGARTALVSESYSDEAGTLGMELISRAEMKELFGEVDRLGFQIAVHAIGDAAVRNVLAALEPVCAGGKNSRRHRVEHLTLCPPDCVAWAARIGVVAVVQPQFVSSDSWLKDRLGPRMRDAYPYRQLKDAGVRLSLSSDAPVEKIDPVACLRETTQWRSGLTHAEAVEAYTAGSAYVTGMEDLGAIAVGKRAVFSVERPGGFDVLRVE